VKITKPLLSSVRRRAFPMTQRVPNGTTAMLREAIVRACELRALGATGTQIYRSFMEHWRESRKVCQRGDCLGCETDVAIGQRIIFAVLAAIMEGER
jgi:hypothetical protein